jgi:hypothetical protein
LVKKESGVDCQGFSLKERLQNKNEKEEELDLNRDDLW